MDSLSELPRTLFEVLGFAVQWPWVLLEAPRGKNHPVLVLPGFAGGDASTAPLRRVLNTLGYDALPWLQGTNTGNPGQLDAVMQRFERLHATYDTPVSLVGQSLGGVYAREIARAFPDAARCVITLGSPYRIMGSEGANPLVARLFRRIAGMSIDELRHQLPEERDDGLSMPLTSVYSQSDGVVGWRTCIEPTSGRRENIRIAGSHTGMALNPDVLRVVADRLAQDPDNWQPFDSTKGCRRFVYPKAHA